MTFLVDANVLAYANADPATALGRSCSMLVEGIAGGKLDGRASTAILEELWHLELRGRPSGLEGATADTYAIFTPLLPVTDTVVAAALALDAPSSLGANDRIHVATCLASGIEAIVTTDRAFDAIEGIVSVDPLDESAISR